MLNKHILLVDDDRLILATLSMSLRAAGYFTVSADSGEAAIEIAESTPVDLAVLDVRMPGLSGIETARHLREKHGIPVVFLSAYNDTELVEQAVQEGAVGYIVKPVEAAQLIPTIETALVRSRDINALFESKAHLERALEGGRYTSTAVGILMERRKISRRQAFELLRNGARKRRIKLEEFAAELVMSSDRINDL